MRSSALIPLTSLLWLCLLAGCSEPPTSNVPANIASTGNSLAVRADMGIDAATGTDTGIIAVSAAAYVDATRQMLVGGDVFTARSGATRIHLASDDTVIGNYAGRLENVSASSTLDIAIEYDTAGTAAHRWFSAAGLVTNPGAGPLVGTAASLSFPPSVTMLTPPANQAYRYLSDIAQITWTPPVGSGAGDSLALAWSHNCVGFSSIRSAGLLSVPAASAAAGAHDLRMDEILQPPTPDDIAGDILLGVVATLLYVSTGGLIEPVPPVDDDPSDGCVIRLTLYNQRNNPLPAGFVGGAVTSSRSHTINLRYIPPLP